MDKIREIENALRAGGEIMCVGDLMDAREHLTVTELKSYGIKVGSATKIVKALASSGMQLQGPHKLFVNQSWVVYSFLSFFRL